MKVYLASSWRNTRYPDVLARLRAEGHEVYDFKDQKTAFSWDQIDPNWKKWDSAQFDQALRHPLARDGFLADFRALDEADALVLLLPCGRSAHLEAGYAAGQRKPVAILLDDRNTNEPELMYRMADVCLSIDDVIECLSLVERGT